MASDMETAFREFLLDPTFWRPRLEKLAQIPRELALFPRPDLDREGLEVVELRLRAHDGTRLRGLWVRPAFPARGSLTARATGLGGSSGDGGTNGSPVDLVTADFLCADEVDWARALDEGISILVCERSPSRHLEDRVLDLLRFAGAACELEDVDCTRVHFKTCPGRDHDDALRIAESIRDRGWLQGR